MITDESQYHPFLLELYNQTGGDQTVKVSMHAVGAVIGLEKAEAGKMAEEVIGLGWAEVRTLSGGIGITADGVAAARQAGAAPAGGFERALSDGPFMDADDCAAVEALLDDIRGAVAGLSSDYGQLESLVIDAKTLTVQLLSPRPRTSIVREVLRALKEELEKAGAKQVSERIDHMIA